MSKLGKIDADLAELLNAPRYPYEGKSCANCSHQGWETGDESVGIDGYLYCSHPEIGLDSEDEGARYMLLQEYVESQGGGGDLDEAIANICPHYYPMMIPNCTNCGKSINIPQEEWQLYGDAFCSYEGIHPVPVCSQKCLEAVNHKAEADSQAYQENLLKYQNNYWAEDNYQPTSEEEYLADLAFDAAREKRFTSRID